MTDFGEIEGSYSDSEGEVLEEDEECSGEEEEDIDCVVGSAADQNTISTEVQDLAMGRRVTPIQVVYFQMTYYNYWIDILCQLLQKFSPEFTKKDDKLDYW